MEEDLVEASSRILAFFSRPWRHTWRNNARSSSLPHRRLGRTRRRHAGLGWPGSSRARGDRRRPGPVNERLHRRKRRRGGGAAATIDHEPPPPSGLSPSTHPSPEVEERQGVALGRRRRSTDLAPTSFSTNRSMREMARAYV